MMVAEQHIVEKVSVNVNVTSTKLAEKIQSEIGDFIKNELLPVIESYFEDLSSRFDIEDQVIQLDKVDLSISTSKWSGQSEKLKQEIRAEVEKEMERVLKKAVDTGSSSKRLTKKSEPSEEEVRHRVYSKEERVVKSFFYFLEKGTMPWWIKSLEESRKLFSEKVLLDAFSEKPEIVLQELKRNGNDSVIVERLMNQFSPVIVANLLVRKFGVASENKLLRISHAIEKEFFSSNKKYQKEIIRMLWYLAEDVTYIKREGEMVFGQLFQHFRDTVYVNQGTANGLDAALSSSYIGSRMLSLIIPDKIATQFSKETFLNSLSYAISSEKVAALREIPAYRTIFGDLGGESSQQKQSEEVKIADLSDEDQVKSNQGGEEDEIIRKQEKEIEAAGATKKTKEQVDSGKEVASKHDKVADEVEELNQTDHPLEKKRSDDNYNSSFDKTNESEVEQDMTNTEATQLDNSERIAGKERSNEEHPEENNSVERNLHQQASDQITSEITAGKQEGNESDQSAISGSELNKESEVSLQSESDDRQIDSLKSEIDKDETPKATQVEELEKGDVEESTIDQDKKSNNNSASSETRSQLSLQKNEPSPNESSEEHTIEENTRTSSEKSETKEKNQVTESQLESRQGKEPVDNLSSILKEKMTRAAELKRKQEAAKLKDHLFVDNAGLVLLNPFLPTLFKHMELIGNDGKLLDREMAAAILHYAATGREGDYEFEMTFEKYLCGIPPLTPLSREIKLSDAQKEEINKMLSAALEHWKALKSSSPALLQNEFLKRPGKLIFEKANHHLVIEKKTFDLLLDKLPWSYSVIKFSWLKELIFVEW